MRKVKLQNVTMPGEVPGTVQARRMYTVTLGNHHSVHFTSERDALQFQAETARWLNGLMFELNLLLVDAYAAQRAVWPLYGMDGSDVHKLRNECAKAALHVRDAEHMLDRAPTHQSANSVFFAWRDLRSAATYVQKAAQCIMHVHRVRTNGVERQRMHVLATRCADLLLQLQNYGTNAPRGDAFTRSPY